MNFNIFKKKYSNLFTIYGNSIDTLTYILHSIGYNLKNSDSEKAKKECIYVIEQLLLYDIIKVEHWGKNHNLIKNLNLNIEQTANYVRSIWVVGDTNVFCDELITFNYKEWYLKKMKTDGINIDTDWKWFADVYVPNLKEWIEKNRLKDN